MHPPLMDTTLTVLPSRVLIGKLKIQKIRGVTLHWGDHQIIYLLKLLELSHQFHPNQLSQLLRKPVFSYANVPYRIKPFSEIKANPKSTVTYDTDMRIESNS